MASVGDAGGGGWRAKVGEVRNRDWNPVGNRPEDEYDSNITDVAAMLRGGASDDRLLKYLAWAEIEYLGLKRFHAPARGGLSDCCAHSVNRSPSAQQRTLMPPEPARLSR